MIQNLKACKSIFLGPLSILVYSNFSKIFAHYVMQLCNATLSNLCNSCSIRYLIEIPSTILPILKNSIASQIGFFERFSNHPLKSVFVNSNRLQVELSRSSNQRFSARRLNGISPLVISRTNSGSGSKSMTWKCSTPRTDFRLLQFLNHITCEWLVDILFNTFSPSYSTAFLISSRKIEKGGNQNSRFLPHTSLQKPFPRTPQ